MIFTAGFLAAVTTVREEILQDPLRESFRIYSLAAYIPFPWWFWLLVLLLLVAFFVFEGCYRQYKMLRDSVDCQESLQILGVEIDHHLLRANNPRLQFEFYVYNGTTRKIGINKAEGSFWFGGDKFPGKIEYEFPEESVAPRETFSFTLYQWLNENDTKRILSKADQEGSNHISFAFIKARAIFKCHEKELRLLIPETLQFDIKNHWTLSPHSQLYVEKSSS